MKSDRGPWTVVDGALPHLRSDDFEHDVVLSISGDFATREDRLEYAKDLARRLNSTAPTGDST